MSSLKVIKNSIKSVNNTKKITRTMRLVSAAKYSRAERELEQIRPFGMAPQTFFEATGLNPVPNPKSRLLLAVSGDRGLCGAIHSGVAKSVHFSIEDFKRESTPSTNLICVGDKCRVILSRVYSDKILWSASEVGKKPMTFKDAGHIAEEVLESMEEQKYCHIEIFFNKFINASSYTVTSQSLYDFSSITSSPNFPLYDGVDDHIVTCWLEFAVVSMIFWILREGSASEHSARMTAMENATKNASDMLKHLDLQFNRTRQAVITRELIEIISGASAVQ